MGSRNSKKPAKSVTQLKWNMHRKNFMKIWLIQFQENLKNMSLHKKMKRKWLNLIKIQIRLLKKLTVAIWTQSPTAAKARRATTRNAPKERSYSRLKERDSFQPTTQRSNQCRTLSMMEALLHSKKKLQIPTSLECLTMIQKSKSRRHSASPTVLIKIIKILKSQSLTMAKMKNIILAKIWSKTSKQMNKIRLLQQVWSEKNLKIIWISNKKKISKILMIKIWITDSTINCQTSLKLMTWISESNSPKIYS